VQTRSQPEKSNFYHKTKAPKKFAIKIHRTIKTRKKICQIKAPETAMNQLSIS
jgi:hypothetical protein